MTAVGFDGVFITIFVLSWASSFLVTMALTVRLSRSIELTGRLKGPSTVRWLAGGQGFLNLIVVALVFEPLPRSYGAREVALIILVPLACALCSNLLIATIFSVLPRRRRTGPQGIELRIFSGFIRATLAIADLVVVGMCGLLVHAIITSPPSRLSDWLAVFMVVLLSPSLVALYVRRGRRTMLSYLRRLGGPLAGTPDRRPRVLYLRPFNVENRLFAGSQTFEAFLDREIAERIGPLVALGDPTDRMPPDGAKRMYYDDREWRLAVERLAVESLCIVGMTSASPNTAWELRRVRDLGLAQRLYLLSPPAAPESRRGLSSDATTGRMRKSLAFVGRSMRDWLSQDWDALAGDVSFGRLPDALSPIDSSIWDDLGATLIACGYIIEISDPGPGTVIGFGRHGEAVVVAHGALTPAEFVQPIADRVALPDR